MKIEDGVSNLKLSKRLAELGVLQDSIWEWILFDNGSEIEMNPFKLCLGEDYPVDRNGRQRHIFQKVSAYTVAELGEVLRKSGLVWSTHPEQGIVEFEDARGKWIKQATGGRTEANIRASMLIYLIENKLTKK